MPLIHSASAPRPAHRERGWGEGLSRDLKRPRQPALEHDHNQQERTPDEVLPERIEFEGALTSLEVQCDEDQSQQEDAGEGTPYRAEATGQLAHSLHFLALSQRLLGLLQLRHSRLCVVDIAPDRDEVFAIGLWSNSPFDVLPTAVAGADAVRAEA